MDPKLELGHRKKVSMRNHIGDGGWRVYILIERALAASVHVT